MIQVLSLALFALIHHGAANVDSTGPGFAFHHHGNVGHPPFNVQGPGAPVHFWGHPELHPAHRHRRAADHLAMFQHLRPGYPAVQAVGHNTAPIVHGAPHFQRHRRAAPVPAGVLGRPVLPQKPAVTGPSPIGVRPPAQASQWSFMHPSAAIQNSVLASQWMNRFPQRQPQSMPPTVKPHTAQVPKPSFLHPDNPSNKPFVAGFNAPKPPTTAPPKPAASFNPSGPTLRPAFTTSAPSVTTVTPKPQKKIGLFGF